MIMMENEVTLAYMIELMIVKQKINDVEVVKEYSDVFPDEFPALPVDREVEFTIDLASG